VLFVCTDARAQESTVTAQVELSNENSAHHAKNRANVVVWLSPLQDTSAMRPASETGPGQRLRLLQKDKRFEPHVLVVPVGAAVEFPNHDPFFHNVFSLFEGKRFDLGLYEAGTSRLVHFDRPGVSYIFCNIHPEMSAVVVAVKTPYYATSDAVGKLAIERVPPGRYLMQVWAEGSSAENLKALNREVTVSGTEHSLGVIRVVEDAPPTPHKNKYGRDYDAPGSDYPPTAPK
jgi:plastocyanin